MAKTYGGLFERIAHFDTLEAAYRRARRGKRTRREVMEFERDLEGNLIQLQNELLWGRYRTGAYRRFTLYEPKERQCAALPFRDRVVQHALVSVIEPLWERRFVADSYACRPGRGMHRGTDRAQAMLRAVLREHGKVYVLKGDVRQFFASIDHDVVKRLARKRIRCRRTLSLLDNIIDSAAPRGLPIGNLTSQLLANVYLHELDEFAKHHLRERRYMRYMDDFIVVHHDKAHLHAVRAQIEAWLAGTLKLSTNSKTQVFPVRAGRGRALDYLGYRIWPTHRMLRRSSVDRVTRSLRRLRKLYAAGRITLARVRATVVSWVAHASHASTAGLRNKVLANAKFQRDEP